MKSSSCHQYSTLNNRTRIQTGGGSMKGSTQLQPLKLSEDTPFSFPPHRRRPLRSHTYFNLIHLLSHCPTDFPHPQTQGDIDDVELRLLGEENVPLNCDEMKSADLLVPEDTLAQVTAFGKSKANIGFQDGRFDGKQTTVPELDRVNLLKEGEQEVAQANSISVGDFLVDENQNVDCSVQIFNKQENVDNIVELQTFDFGPMGHLELNNEFCIDDFSEVLDSCFGMDMVVKSSKLGEDSKENSSALEMTTSKDFEHQVQLKEMELEKLVSMSGAVDSSCPVTADEEIEEGEISGEAGVSDASIDALSKDAISLGGITAGIVHASEDNADKEEFINEDVGLPRYDTCDPSLIGIVGNDNDCIKVELRASSRQMQDIQSQNVFCDSYIETQEIDPIACSLETLPLSGRSKILQENANENPISSITEKDGDGSKKKRKNGPLTKERRAKKKKKDRLKRAEKNRKLGIKRLKLQPVLKSKTITYCRHYLQGRCHEGEKCKFSHDTTPLTKSKPCGHFARHSCMKGDDCPFDHQLSNYACTNYTSTGFCSRGADCFFSHKMPAKQIMSTTSSDALKPVLKSDEHAMPDKEGSFMASKASKPEVTFIAQLHNSNTSNPADILASHHKVDAKFYSARDSPGKNTEKHVAKPFARIVAQAPKGVSFLSDAKMSLGHNRMLKIDGPFQKANDGVDVGHEAILKMPGSINKLTEMSERVASRKPRGINFLSFAQSSLDDSSSKTFSNMFSNSYKETGKQVMADLAEGKQNRFLPRSGDFFKVNSQISQSATTLAQNMNEEANRTPVTLPLQMNSLSLGQTQLDDSRLRKSVDFHCYKGDTFKTSLLSNTPSLVQKAVQSTLAFAAKFEPEIKLDSSFTNGETSSSQVDFGHS